MLKKRLIALMVTGVVTTATLTGCGDSADSSIVKDTLVVDNSDKYIIINQNDTEILHKGKHNADFDSSVSGFIFDCGEDFLSNAEYFVSFQEPKAERYDEKCKECFDLN